MPDMTAGYVKFSDLNGFLKTLKHNSFESVQNQSLIFAKPLNMHINQPNLTI